MFGVGTAELILIFVIALIIFGPKKLPEFSRKLAKLIKEIRKLTKEIWQK
jgi:TatA/E family protein of Tat protein translocase